MDQQKTDEELMQAYQLGDQLAFSELYRRHSQKTWSYIRRRIQDQGLAEDVFQSTFMKVHKSRSRYAVKFPFSAWLFTICRSETIDALRKQGRNAKIVTEVLSAESLSQVGIDQDLILNQVALTTEQQMATQLRYQEDFSFAEIAERMQITPAGARQLISRAVRKLRGFYGKR